jgi:arginyl-tRNA synthetase
MKYKEILEQEIKKILQNTIVEKGLDVDVNSINFEVFIPELKNGDLTTNVCLVASKVLKISPKEIAEKIISHLTSPKIGEGTEQQVPNFNNAINFIEKVEFANPGFLNFWIKKEKVIDTLKNQNEKLENNNFYLENKWTDKKMIVEHTSVNLFKPFTIGHLMSNFIGTFILNINKLSGAKTINLSYPSDKSLGIAKAIWIIKNNGGLEQDIFKKSENEIVKYLGEAYRKGVAEYKVLEEENNFEKIQEVKNISNNIFKNIESEDLKIFEETKKINLNYFENILEKMNSHFDEFIFESEAGEVGKEIVLENVDKVFKKSEGAIVYIPDENRKDISTSVFLNSEGNPTYLAKDIGLLKIKFDKFNPDFSYYVVDNEQIPHFKSVFAAAKDIDENFKKFAEKSVHIPHGRMTFKGQKMSSRLGGVPSGEEVLEVVLSEVKERSSEKLIDLSGEEKEQVQMEIALAAIRISILRSKLGVNIDFDPERTLSFEGDSGPYLCYTFARCCSLLEKGKVLEQTTPSFASQNPPLLSEGELSEIERKIFQYENILENVVENIAPQNLVTYLFELTSLFNNFYANNKIIDENNLEKTSKNLFIVNSVKNVLKHGLLVLGINAPERM